MKIGIDLIEIERIVKAAKSTHFLNRVYSEEEQTFLKKPESFAGNFAAKEAFSKAVGTGIRGFSMNEVSVLRNELGQPFIKLSGNAYELFSDLAEKISVTITHDKTSAAAVVIIE